ncbi:MAG: N-acetylmuramoyl-L-alanine amidase [Smithellaceae bacterium]
MKIRYTLIIIAVILASANFSCATEIQNVRHWAAPDHTRVVIDVDSEPSFEIQEGKNFLILNFKEGLSRPALPDEIFINKPGIRKVIIHPISEGSVKVELILDKYLKTQVFKLKKFQDKPDRVVVDIFLQQAPRKEMIKEPSSKIKQKKIIVIDPGHGGDDPGAVGKKGTYEKNIVLAIGREIKKAVNNVPGYRAVLTRDGDYYVSFSKRMQIAKDSNASLFISVHADAARNRQAKGSSIYCLSTGAASSEAAKLLAKNENLSDIIGGVPNGEGKADSDQIILNMFQTNTINLSKTYAANLMRELDRINTLKYKSVQEAPFRVLKLPDIPAVLIETAYISNGEEEKLLKSSNFRKKLALAVVSSAVEYLSGTASIAQSSDAVDGSAKTVNPGEKKAPAKVNNVKVSSRIYTVKKGDTLFSLAKSSSITIDELRKLNHMKGSDPLLLGQKIRLP